MRKLIEKLIEKEGPSPLQVGHYLGQCESLRGLDMLKICHERLRSCETREVNISHTKRVILSMSDLGRNTVSLFLSLVLK